MTAPLVPANLDLADFLFMPFEFDRLFQSETWVLANDAEKVAALTLWGKAWREVPAGSLPNDDRMLAHLSGAGPRWKRLKPQALRGWVDGGDGRLYHPVVCEKALEAWIEKLGSRVRGGTGNATRWGAEFDPEPIIAEIVESRRLLKALNPDSRALRKAIPKGPKSDPARNPASIPQGVLEGSQGTGTGTGTGTVKATAGTTRDPSDSPRAPTPAAQACVAMRKAGLIHVNPAHPRLLEALDAGVTVPELEATAREAIAHQPPKGFAWAIATALGRRNDAAQGANHDSSSQPPRRLSAFERVEANIARARAQRGEQPDDHGGGSVIEGQATRVAR